jgi:hypothetical protein
MYPGGSSRRRPATPEIEAIHRDVRAQAAAALGVIVGHEAGGGGSDDPMAHETAAEIVRIGDADFGESKLYGMLPRTPPASRASARRPTTRRSATCSSSAPKRRSR